MDQKWTRKDLVKSECSNALIVGQSPNTNYILK